MGRWGDEPWDNDTAADWFGDLFDATKLADRVAAGLAADIEEEPEVVWAATHLVALLCHTYVWPVDVIDKHLQLALEKLQALEELGELPKKTIRKQIRVITKRLAPAKPAVPDKGLSAETPDGTPVLKLAWTADLASPEQRSNLPNGWTVLEPWVRGLCAVGPDRIAAVTRYNGGLFSNVGKRICDINPRDDDYVLFPVQPTTASTFLIVREKSAELRAVIDGERLQSWRWSAGVAAAKASKDGSRAVIVTFDGRVHVLDLSSGAELFDLEHKRPARAERAGLAIRGDGSVCATGWNGSVCFWDLRTGELIKKNRNKWFMVSFSADDTRALTRSAKGHVEWDVATGKKRRTFELALREKGTGTRVTPDGRWMLTETAVTFGRKHGEIQSVRLRTNDEPDFFGSFEERRWQLPDSRILTTRDACNEEGREVAGEVRIYQPDPLKLVAAARIERRIGADGYRSKEGRFGRVTSNHAGNLILVGDADARIYAFEVASAG